MKTILVPTDFSDSATNALRYAVAIAQKAKATLKILHIYNIPVIPGNPPYLPYPNDVQENIKLAEQKLKDLELEVPELQTVTYETKTLPGYWAIEIPEIIQSQNVDLTVMGTTGASGLKEIILGSNTASVIKGAIRPVLAIPEQAKYKKIQNIGFAYDHDTITEKIQTLVVLAKLFNADIRIFHVKEKTESAERNQSIFENSFNYYLEGIHYNYTSFNGDNIEEGISKYIENENIDVLAMIPRRHNLFHRLFKNSHTEKMAFHSKIPLLAIPE